MCIFLGDASLVRSGLSLVLNRLKMKGSQPARIKDHNWEILDQENILGKLLDQQRSKKSCLLGSKSLDTRINEFPYSTYSEAGSTLWNRGASTSGRTGRTKNCLFFHLL